jgi:hypothetical protein
LGHMSCLVVQHLELYCLCKRVLLLVDACRTSLAPHSAALAGRRSEWMGAGPTIFQCLVFTPVPLSAPVPPALATLPRLHSTPKLNSFPQCKQVHTYCKARDAQCWGSQCVYKPGLLRRESYCLSPPFSSPPRQTLVNSSLFIFANPSICTPALNAQFLAKATDQPAFKLCYPTQIISAHSNPPPSHIHPSAFAPHSPDPCVDPLHMEAVAERCETKANLQQIP